MKSSRNIIGWHLLLLLLITPLMVEAATGEVDISIVYQELEGFGASNVWSGNTLVSLGNYDPNIYDVIFGDLGLDILRLRNPYDYENYYLNNCKHTVTKGRERTGRPLKIMISSWSPPGDLKSNGKTVGGTLKKDAYGDYMYDEFADWWADSLDAWAADYGEYDGIVADYINIQNEPNWVSSWDTCLFDPTESPSVAGYDQAFEAVYQELYSRMGSAMPKMLAAEARNMTRSGDYFDNLIDDFHAYGWAHHLYGDGGSAANPDGYIPTMTSFAAQYGDRPILQTEYSDDDHVTTYQACMDLAVLMHNSLVVEGVAGYLYWQLTYGTNEGLVSITNTSWTINPIYYAFKHYSAFTDPGWYRVEASTNSSNLRISAYISPDSNELSVVIINTHASSSVDLDLSFTGFTIDDGDVYRTTSSQNCELVGSYDGTGTLNIPAKSITTISLTGSSLPYYSNCGAVQAAGYGLTSDISGDCYVSYRDLEIIAYYWLRTDCGGVDNCGGSDFEPDSDVDFVDFGTFAVQWMLCNDPEDSNCTPNW